MFWKYMCKVDMPDSVTYPMNGENGELLVTDKAVEFEKSPVGVPDFRTAPDHFYRNLENIPHINKGKQKRCQHVTSWTWKH